MATLLGALLICLNAPTDHHGPAFTKSPAAAAVPAFTCPYEDGSCGLLSAVGPAVLTAPPPDAPLDAGEQLPLIDLPVGNGVAPPAAAQPRAPDLHVLQVLRT